MSRNLTTAFIFSLAFQLCLSFSAFSQCDPKDDPCAPKKEPGAWDKSLAFGFNKTSGNADTTLVNLAGDFDRDYEGNIWDFGFQYNYGEDDDREQSGLDNVSRNDFRSHATYNHLLGDQWFVGLGSKVFYDEIADIDYRVFVDPALGYYFIRDNQFKFKIEAGPSYIFEQVGGIEDDYLAPRIADGFEWALTCTSKIFQTAEILFDVGDSENYLVNAEAGVESALTTALSLVFKVRETYDNQPAEGRERGDLAMITAIKVTL